MMVRTSAGMLHFTRASLFKSGDVVVFQGATYTLESVLDDNYLMLGTPDGPLQAPASRCEFQDPGEFDRRVEAIAR